jgi:hypothetical protein
MKNQKMIFTSILLAVGFLALSPIAQTACPSPNQGCAGGNTADGQSALFSLTTGTYNTGVGLYSLLSLAEGNFNTALGAGTLLANTSSENTAVGAAALLNSTSSAFSTAVGAFALVNATTGGPFGIQANTAIGDRTLFNCTTGFFNTAIGYGAGDDLVDGHGNVYIGQGIGAGAADENDHTYIRNIKDTTVSGGNSDLVTLDLTTGLLGHLSSSRRYKEDIKPMDKASEALYELKPVTYRYKKEIDRTQSCAFGFIAEEVAEVNPDLVARNAKGQPENVHYEMVNAMLLNEFLKEHKKVEEQQASIAELKSTAAQQQKGMEVLTAQLKEQGAQIQKVSAQFEVNKPATKVVTNK